MHGPHPRDYTQKVNKKVKRLAMRMALSSKLDEGNLLVVDKIEIPNPKTKEFVQIQNKLNLKKPLIVVPKKDKYLDLASRNIPKVRVISEDELHVYEILYYQELILTPEVVANLHEKL